MEEISTLASDVGGKPGVIANIDPKTMTKIFKNQLSLIIWKYENLGLSESNTYKFLKGKIIDDTWILNTSTTISKVGGGEKIFNISKQINLTKNDHRVDEAFAEFDTALRLLSVKFFGSFNGVEYIPTSKQSKTPDFMATAESGQNVPVEVKVLSPQDSNRNKFFGKFINKVNYAKQQLEAYKSRDPSFSNGMVFVWIHQPIDRQAVGHQDYLDLENLVANKIIPASFDLTIVVIFSNVRDLWDFYIEKQKFLAA